MYKPKERLEAGVHTISKSEDGQRKMVVIIGKKRQSFTRHLRKRGGAWTDFDGNKY